MEIIKNITSPELQECYRDWYRPDRQAIIIVGDIDVDSMEIDLQTEHRLLQKGQIAAS